jgi:hypothetical protein
MNTLKSITVFLAPGTGRAQEWRIKTRVDDGSPFPRETIHGIGAQLNKAQAEAYAATLRREFNRFGGF